MPDVDEAAALLIEIWAQAQPDPNDFNDWYDQEYSSALAGLPGVLNAQRYTGLANDGVSVALYDLTDAEALKSSEYQDLRRDVTSKQIEMIKHLSRYERLVYRITESHLAEGVTLEQVPAPILGCNWWEPLPEGDADLNRWYAEEHIPLILRVPGWIRSRRYEILSGPGARYLATHEVESTSVYAHPLHQEANRTPWRDRVIATREQYERRAFSLSHRSG